MCDGSLMEETPSTSRDVVVTLVSVWSAMFGGALGAALGGMSGPLVCNAVIGFIGGVVFSVLMFLPLVGLTQAVAMFIVRREMEGRPIGCVASDRLSAILGGVAGAVGATVVASLPDDYDLMDPRAFVICWTVAAFVPIILGFGLAMRVRWLDKG
jgi:hypothetical protein